MIRLATSSDISILARLNHELIRDEGHRNPMNLGQLEERMISWLDNEYSAIVYQEGDHVLGYTLFRQDADYTYLRQLYVVPEGRRRGIGRGLVTWLIENIKLTNRRLRIEVLIHNTAAIEFWHSVEFKDYCLTMEFEQPAG